MTMFQIPKFIKGAAAAASIAAPAAAAVTSSAPMQPEAIHGRANLDGPLPPPPKDARAEAHFVTFRQPKAPAPDLYEATLKVDKQIKAWQPAKDEPAVPRYNHHSSAAVSPDGTKVVIAVNKSGLEIFDTSTGKQTPLFKYGGPNFMVERSEWSADRTKLAFVVSEKQAPANDLARPTYGNAAVVVYDMNTNKQIIAKAIGGHGQVAFNEKGTEVVVAYPVVNARANPQKTSVNFDVYTTADGKNSSSGTIDTGPKSPEVRAVAFVDGGKKVAVAHGHSPDRSHSLTVSDPTGAGAVTTKFASKFFDANVKVEKGKFTGVQGSILELDGKVLYSTPTFKGQVFAHGSESKEFGTFVPRVEKFAVSPKASLIAAFGRAEEGGPGEIRLYNAKTLEHVSTIDVGHSYPARELRFSDDGKALTIIRAVQESKDKGEVLDFKTYALRMRN